LRRITVSLAGGLGNQLFQFAAGLNLVGEGVLGLEMQLTIPTKNAQGEAEILSFCLPGNVAIESKRRTSKFTMKSTNALMMIGKSAYRNPHIPGVGLIKAAASVVISAYMRRPLHLIAAKGIGFHEVDLKPRNNFLVGYFQSYVWPEEENVKRILNGLELKNPSSELAEYTKLSELEKPLIVNVRLGDYKSIDSFGIPSPQYYEKSILSMIEKNKFEKIWVFSNEIELARDYIPQEFHDKCRWIEDVGNSASVTFQTMRLGSGYVIGNSTYSWWAAFLSRSGNSPVIAPTPWFRSEPSPLELTPPHWELFEAWPHSISFEAK